MSFSCQLVPTSFLVDGNVGIDSFPPRRTCWCPCEWRALTRMDARLRLGSVIRFIVFVLLISLCRFVSVYLEWLENYVYIHER